MDLKQVGILVVVAGIVAFVWQNGSFGKKSQDDLVMEQFEQSLLRQRCLSDWEWVKNEIDRRLQYASRSGDMRAIEAYRPLAYELAEIGNRLQNPNWNPAKEEERIRQIRAMVIKSMSQKIK